MNKSVVRRRILAILARTKSVPRAFVKLYPLSATIMIAEGKAPARTPKGNAVKRTRHEKAFDDLVVFTASSAARKL